MAKKIRGQDGKMYKVKKPFFKRIWFWFVIIVVSVGVAGLFGSDSGESGSSNDTSERKSSGSTTESTSEKESNVVFGQEGTSSNMSLKVNSFEERNEIATAGGYASYKPDDGGKFALVSVTLKNVGEKSVSTSHGYFKLIHGTIEYSPSTLVISGTEEKFFTFESMNPGLESTGFIAFQVPTDFVTSDAQLRFDGTGLFNDPLTFNLH